jgi:sugar-specific transcriptional regulator TrmB
MIENDRQLEHSITSLAKMYRLRDREAAETRWDSETRDDVIEGTVSMIRKIERETAVYLAKKYQIAAEHAEKAA